MGCQGVSREPPACPTEQRGWVAMPPLGGTLPAAPPWNSPNATLGPCHPLYPGQIPAGKGTCQHLHLAGVFLPRCQPPVLRLTCLLPARQLSGWDLGVHLPHSPLLRKEEGAEEVLQRRAPGSGLRVKGTQEEGRVQTDQPSTRETQPCCPGAGGLGPQTRHRAARAGESLGLYLWFCPGPLSAHVCAGGRGVRVGAGQLSPPACTPGGWQTPELTPLP